MRIVGVGVSPGVCVGRVHVYAPPPPPSAAQGGGREGHLQRLEQAREAVDAELARLVSRLPAREAAEIFEAHRVLLADPLLWDRLRRLVQEGGLDAVSALRAVERELAAPFEAMQDERFRTRAADIRDVCQRLLRALGGAPRPAGPPEPSVVVAHELLPSETAEFERHHLLGFVTELGGPTAHVAILARALGIPAVVGADGVVQHARDGMIAVVDGREGVVILSPSPDEMQAYAARASAPSQVVRRPQEPAATADGRRLTLWANAGSSREVEAAFQSGAEGIGLLRTEFLFLGRPQPPDEDEQFAAYRGILERCQGRPLTIRLLDVGGDKPLPGVGVPNEANPFLGLRGVRLLLRRRELLLTQLRALLRAAAYGPLRILVPMVTRLEEVEEVRAAVGEAARELARGGGRFRPDVPVGAMVETPAAALMVSELPADFFSLGTNDLVQYTLAVDRTNAAVAELYQPLHPAVLRLIQEVTLRARGRGVDVEVCGEMAGDPELALVLVGLGVGVLSVAPPALGTVREALRAHRVEDLHALADQVLRARTAEEAQAVLRALGRT